MQLKHNEEMPNPTKFMVQIGENHYSNPKLKFHKLLTKCWLLQGVCVGSFCFFAPQMEPTTSNEYSFSPSPSTASPLH